MNSTLLNHQIHKIEARRILNGVSIVEISAHLGVHTNTWHNWRNTNFESCQAKYLTAILKFFEKIEDRSLAA